MIFQPGFAIGETHALDVYPRVNQQNWNETNVLESMMFTIYRWFYIIY